MAADTGLNQEAFHPVPSGPKHPGQAVHFLKLCAALQTRAAWTGRHVDEAVAAATQTVAATGDGG